MMTKTPLSVLYRYKWLWAALALIVCAVYGYAWLMHPKINPNPVEKITIRGVFPFDKGVELRYQQGYYTRNPLCSYMARAFFIFPQARVSREMSLPVIPVKRTSENSYEAEFFMDQVSPGFCEWTLRFVHFLVFYEGQLAGTSALLGFPTVVNSIKFNCAFSKYRTWKGTPIFTCLQQGRGTRGPKSREATVNYSRKKGSR